MANKNEVITKIAEKTGLTKKDSELALKGFIESVEEFVASGEKVQLVGFGTFEPRKRAAREVPLHPGKAGDTEKRMIPESTVPVFKAGKEFKIKVKGE
ncbi:HU family DNA-binding protein [Clostridium sp. MT-14]|uniref:HU family DNA-binding protein n=1 Tax=Clostridium sp. MT-14 TaxID=3348360 RepID=UPI0035F44FAA